MLNRKGILVKLIHVNIAQDLKKQTGGHAKIDEYANPVHLTFKDVAFLKS